MKKTQFFLYKYNKNLLIVNNLGIKNSKQTALFQKLFLLKGFTLNHFFLTNHQQKKNKLIFLKSLNNFQNNASNGYVITHFKVFKKINWCLKKYYIIMIYKRITFTKNLNKVVLSKLLNNYFSFFYTTWFLNQLNIICFFNLFLSYPLNIRSLRLIFGLPVNGQKSRSNNNTNKKNLSYFLTTKYYYFSKLFVKTSKQLFKAEYVNLFWQAFFNPSWKSNKKSITFIKTKSKYIDVSSLNLLQCFNNKVFLKNTKNQKKKKSDSKKKNLGFSFGFTKKFKQKLLTTI